MGLQASVPVSPGQRWQLGLQLNRRMQTYKEVTGYASDGNPLYQVKVVDSKVGEHGYPCGDGTPGERILQEDMGRVGS